MKYVVLKKEFTYMHTCIHMATSASAIKVLDGGT